MKDLRDPLINRYRIKLAAHVWKGMGVNPDEVEPRFNGAFVIPYHMLTDHSIHPGEILIGGVWKKIPEQMEVTNMGLRVIAASGGGWDHVSVSLENRCPTWDEMEYIARMFFREDETAIQYHLPAKDHINIHPFVLHWWRPYSKFKKIPMPPKVMV